MPSCLDSCSCPWCGVVDRAAPRPSNPVINCVSRVGSCFFSPCTTFGNEPRETGEYCSRENCLLDDPNICPRVSAMLGQVGIEAGIPHLFPSVASTQLAWFIPVVGCGFALFCCALNRCAEIRAYRARYQFPPQPESESHAAPLQAPAAP